MKNKKETISNTQRFCDKWNAEKTNNVKYTLIKVAIIIAGITAITATVLGCVTVKHDNSKKDANIQVMLNKRDSIK